MVGNWCKHISSRDNVFIHVFILFLERQKTVNNFIMMLHSTHCNQASIAANITHPSFSSIVKRVSIITSTSLNWNDGTNHKDDFSSSIFHPGDRILNQQSDRYYVLDWYKKFCANLRSLKRLNLIKFSHEDIQSPLYHLTQFLQMKIVLPNDKSSQLVEYYLFICLTSLHCMIRIFLSVWKCLKIQTIKVQSYEGVIFIYCSIWKQFKLHFRFHNGFYCQTFILPVDYREKESSYYVSLHMCVCLWIDLQCNHL